MRSGDPFADAPMKRCHDEWSHPASFARLIWINGVGAPLYCPRLELIPRKPALDGESAEFRRPRLRFRHEV